jgi:lysophospholipase L1-like esterase
MESAERMPETTPFGYDYFKLRGGLKNSRIKFERTGHGRVVFLGGSITRMDNGWRDMVGKELQKRFPNTKFDFIDAGIPSTGSVPGSFRMQRDVFAHGPVDLLFEEAAVNDSTNRGKQPQAWLRGMEGIIRQARLTNPDIDIVLLDFADPDKIKTYRSGKTPEVIKVHEKAADYYGIPSINLAREVEERIYAGEFTWKKDFRNLHPAPFGHRLYRDSISRLFDAAWTKPLPQNAAVKPYSIPQNPLDKDSYFNGRLVDIKTITPADGWKIITNWKPAKGGTRPGFVNVPVLEGDTPGAEQPIKFKGTAVGIFVAAGFDAGTIEYSIDSGSWKELELFTQWSRGLHIPWAHMLATGLTPADHTLSIRIADKKNPKSQGRACRIVHLLVN